MRLLKTRGLIFLVICMLCGGGIALIAGGIAASINERTGRDVSQTEIIEETTNIELNNILKLTAEGGVLGAFVFMLFGAFKKIYEKIFALDSDLKIVRKQFSQLGMGVFAIQGVSFVIQLIIVIVLEFIYPDGGKPSWLVWLCTFVPQYLIAVPIGLLIIRKAPVAPREGYNLKFSQIFTVAIICIFMMHAGNIVGKIVIVLLQTLLGITSVNPTVFYTMDSSVWLKILFAGILAPIIEEYIYRKQMIDRMNIYGEKLAVVTSALMFGLVHGNLSQLFYAFTLGLVFGYVYLKTGKLRYTVGLHMLINFRGIVVSSLLRNMDFSMLETLRISDPAAWNALLSPQLVLFGAYILCLIGFTIAGLVLLYVKRRSICFAMAEQELPKGTKFKTVYLNIGMILFAATCLISIILMMD